MFRRVLGSLVGAALLACAAAPATPAAQARPNPSRPPQVPQKSAAALGSVAPITEQNVERIEKIWDAAVGGFGKAVAVHRGLDRAAVATDSTFRIYSLRTGKPIESDQACAPILRGGLSFAEGVLVVACSDALARIDGKTLKALPAVEIDPSPVTAAHIQYPWVALGHHDGTIRIYSLAGEPTRKIEVPGPPIDVKSLALGPGGERIAVAWVQGSIWWWNTAAPDEPHRLVRHSHESDTVAFSHSGDRFAEEGEPHTTTVWSFASAPEQETTLRNGDWIKRLLFTKDDRWLLRGGSDGLELAEIAGPRRVVLDSAGAVEDAAFDERGATIAAIDRKGRLAVWQAR